MNLTHKAFTFAQCFLNLFWLAVVASAQTAGETPAAAPPLVSWSDIAKAVVGFVFGLVTFGVQRLFTRERRELTANITTFSLLSLPESIRGQVKVQFQDQQVNNIISQRVTFLNSGNKVVQDHAVSLKLGGDSTVLHVDPGQRFELIRMTSDAVELKLKFLNPRSVTEVRVTTTGGVQQDLTVDGEGPGVSFKSGEKILPVLDPNMTAEEVQKRVIELLRSRFKKQLWWLIPIYIAFFALMFLFLYLL